ncbi:MAG: flagellar assembly protein FliW [Halanaerobium sp.]|nr:flagellar assembly protein FliW [Halanaerobium sp.]
MELMTRDFGKVDIDQNEVIKFTQGLPGFENYREYVLLTLPGPNPFFILQSVEEQELAFITVDPWEVVSGYEVNINDGDKSFLKITNKEEVLILVIGTIHEELSDMTVNLAAPLIINVRAKLGKQIILEESGYAVRQPIFSQEAKEQVVK